MNHLNQNLIKVINHPEFIATLKANSYGAGLKLMPRNPNRKQYYPEKNRTVTLRDGKTYTRKSCYQQDLPRKFATYFVVYGPYEAKQIVKEAIKLFKSKGIDVLYKA